MSNDEKRKCTDNKILFLPQEELEGIYKAVP